MTADRDPHAEEAAPSPAVLVGRLGLAAPIVGLYEVPDASWFEPLARAPSGRCVFAFYDEWAAGLSLHLDAEAFGCPGAGRALLGQPGLPLPELAHYLVHVEGVKESCEAMIEALEAEPRRQPECPHVVIGPLRDRQWRYLRSVTFFVTPDQLGALVMAAHYHRAAPGVPPVVVPSASGCHKLLPVDPAVAQAAIGATDVAIRRFLPPDVLAFTATRSMYARLCALPATSFLFKADLARLRASRARGGR